MNRILSGVLILCCVLSARPASAQDAQIQEMKEKIQRLEQMVGELKTQLAAIESHPASPVPAPGAVKPEAPSVPVPQVPTDYLGSATRRRETASQNETSASRINNEPMDPSLRGFLRFPGTTTLFKPFGYIKTDFQYDLKYAGPRYGLYVPSTFPDTTQPPSRNSTVSARPTRMMLEFRQPFKDSSVKAYIEFDFLGNYDRNSFRLRHAYGQWKNILAGQTWSAFADADAFPDTLEFEGPPGIIFARQAQIRYTQPLNRSNSIGFSVERSGPDISSTSLYGTTVAVADRPDLLFFHRYEGNRGHTQTAFLFRRVGGFVLDSTDPSLSAQRSGYGVSFSTSFHPFKTGDDSVVLQGVIGRGITNYYNDNTGLGLDVGFNAAGQLVAVPSGSLTAGYTHHWNKILRSSVSFGRLQINAPAGAPPNSYDTSYYLTGNLIAQPYTSLLFGAEYVYGWLERKDGFKYIAPRIQLSATYYFNKHPR